jgi:SAM-dependent methyltransferase
MTESPVTRAPARPAEMQAGRPSCRFCGTGLRHSFVDLGLSPLCQTVITPEQLGRMEPFYPLHAFVCHECFLVQLDHRISPAEIFSEYGYFSSYSDDWVEHARRYAEEMRRRLDLNDQSRVVEIASNDGYLLQHFVAAGIPVLGIEPAANVAKAAVQKGIPTKLRFFGLDAARGIAEESGQADLLVGNNVLAHVPELNDFVAGLKALLKPEGMITMEFPHLYRLMEGNQFDTIYHEHFSYFSFMTVQKLFQAHGLGICDVEELTTHGGSLRIYARHANRALAVSPAVEALQRRELEAGMNRLDAYAPFAERVKETKRALLEFLIRVKREGKTVVGYGAPGKGNTLLNYCGIRQDFVDYTVDRSPYKQGKFTPGTRIPIQPPETIAQTRPDYVLILPWNLKDEIVRQTRHIREWGGQFVIPIPSVSVL